MYYKYKSFLYTFKYGTQLVQAFGFQPIRHKYAIFSFEFIKVWRLHRLRHDLSRNMTPRLAIKFLTPYEAERTSVSSACCLMRNMFTFRTTSYNLRGNYILVLPVPKTTSYGLRSFSYHAVKLWNSLPDSVRTLNLTDFKKALARLKFM